MLEILPESEDYVVNTAIPAVAKGGFISESEKNAVADKAVYYSGLSKADFLDHNLAVPVQYFWKNLLKDKGNTIGRLDSRYLGIDKINVVAQVF